MDERCEDCTDGLDFMWVNGGCVLRTEADVETVVAVYGVLFLDWNTTMQEGSEHKPFHKVRCSISPEFGMLLITYRFEAGSGV